MLLGLPLPIFTALHVLISFIGIGAGLAWLISMIGGHWRNGLNTIFLVTTIATSVTGFLFPTAGFTPAQAVGIISLLDLAVAVAALTFFAMKGRWRPIYMVTASIALYLNVFVLVVQAFLHVPFLHKFAPAGNEPPFAAVQGIVLVTMVALGYLAIHRDRRPVAGAVAK